MEKYKELLLRKGFKLDNVPGITPFYAGNLTQEQKENGFLTRYFVLNKISRKLTEVGASTYAEISREINANHLTYAYTFSIFTLLWRVKEVQNVIPLATYNENAVLTVSKTYPELISYITDYEQFKID